MPIGGYLFEKSVTLITRVEVIGQCILSGLGKLTFKQCLQLLPRWTGG